jgi:hypothetical protein
MAWCRIEVLAGLDLDRLIVADQLIFNVALFLEVQIHVRTEARELTEGQAGIGGARDLVWLSVDVNVEDLVGLGSI